MGLGRIVTGDEIVGAKQSRVELEDNIRTMIKHWRPVTAEQEAIIQEKVNSSREELKRMEMKREAREKEWKVQTKARKARAKKWRKQMDEMAEADKVESDRVRARCEASWKQSESRMTVIPQRWNKMKVARCALWDSMDESYNRRRERRLNDSTYAAGATIGEGMDA